MSDELPSLLDKDDFKKFKDLDDEWFLSATGDTIRQYCNWHIYPEMETEALCRVGPTGMILLPTLKVNEVKEISFERYSRGKFYSIGHHGISKDGEPKTVKLSEDDYTIHDSGWIQWHPQYVVNQQSVAMAYTWPKRVEYVTVKFKHGFEHLPPTVAEVAFETTMRAAEKPAGIVNNMTVGPYSYGFSGFGAYLTKEQKNRLSPFALQGIA